MLVRLPRLAQFLISTAPTAGRILVYMKMRKRSKAKPRSDVPPRDGTLPPWLPAGDAWDDLPEAA